MNRRGTGAVLLLISAFLYATKYLCVAIYGSNVASWNEHHFNQLLSFVGRGLTVISIIALIFGCIYLIWAEIDEFIKNKPKNVNTNTSEQTSNI